MQKHFESCTAPDCVVLTLNSGHLLRNVRNHLKVNGFFDVRFPSCTAKSDLENQMLCQQPPGVYSHNQRQQSVNVQQFLLLHPLIAMDHAL